MDNFLNFFTLNIDLALEARDLVRGTTGKEISGVEEQVVQRERIKTTIINIKNEIGARQLGRPIGTYITIESPPLKINDPYLKDELVEAIENSMENLINGSLSKTGTVLLVGLGNWHATPDSLGPKFIEYSPITRHYHQHAPEALVEGMRPTCGIAPGVLGITGLETFEVIKGIVDEVKPEIIIAVDALAAQSVERIGTTIQMANTGIQPGAGIGNRRHALTQEELGVPVIAVGCPTIVNAAVIANQAIKKFCLNTGAMYNDTQAINSIKEILSFFGGGLSVTPKEIDDIIEITARIIAIGISKSLFPGISEEQLVLYAV
ncbi:MAG: GPR endopeptidase [Syntrophomonadaceae bacterium]